MKIPMPRVALAAGLFAAVCCGSVGRAAAGHCDPGPVQGAPGEFDFYLMALSVAPTFCETQGRDDKQCASPSDAAYRAKPVTVHGLWPNKYNTGTSDQPRHCTDDPAGRLPSDLYVRLGSYMPGVADGLEECEWAKHGVCTKLSFEDYYGAVVALAAIAEDAIGSAINDNNLMGARTSLNDLVSMVAAKNPQLAASMTVDCTHVSPRHGGPARSYISGFTVAIGKDLSELPQGQGPTYLPLASFGGHLNSGCQGGAGYLPARYND